MITDSDNRDNLQLRQLPPPSLLQHPGAIECLTRRLADRFFASLYFSKVIGSWCCVPWSSQGIYFHGGFFSSWSWTWRWHGERHWTQRQKSNGILDSVDMRLTRPFSRRNGLLLCILQIPLCFSALLAVLPPTWSLGLHTTPSRKPSVIDSSLTRPFPMTKRHGQLLWISPTPLPS